MAAKPKVEVLSDRYYLADAAFLVGLEGDDLSLLERAHAALLDPVWPLALGRKSYVPSDSVWMEERAPKSSFADRSIEVAMDRLSAQMESLLRDFCSPLSPRTGSGVLRMDQPLFSFAERRFGARFVSSEWVPFPQEMNNVSA